MNYTTNPAKMLVSFVDRNRGDMLVSVAKAAGARGGTIAMGVTEADNRILQALSLADVQQDVVFIIMRDETRAVLDAVKGAAAAAPKKLRGRALLLDVPQVLIRAAGQTRDESSQEQDIRSSHMESGYKLLNVIVNSGFANDVMAAARKAGATGGTILNAQGTGTEEDVKFFGISLVPEKEMLMIVAENSRVKAITDAISQVPMLCKPGGGIIFNMNVEEFLILGK